MSEAAPFFIVGCGRSGTTLLRSMLNHHGEIAVPLESLFIGDYLRAAGSAQFEKVVDRLLAEYELGEWGVPIDETAVRATGSTADAIANLHEQYAAFHGKPRWGQKTPRLVRYGASIRKAFPDARFIHVIRDPRSVVASLMRSPAHRGTAWSGARRWKSDVSAGIALETEDSTGVMRVVYEDLVREPARVLSDVSEFLGVEYDPAMNEYPDRGLGEYSSHYSAIHALLSGPPDDSRIAAWQEELTPQEVELIEWTCADLMQELGYEPITDAGPPSRLSIGRQQAARIVGVIGQIGHYRRHRRGYLSGLIRRKALLRTWSI